MYVLHIIVLFALFHHWNNRAINLRNNHDKYYMWIVRKNLSKHLIKHYYLVGLKRISKNNLPKYKIWNIHFSIWFHLYVDTLVCGHHKRLKLFTVLIYKILFKQCTYLSVVSAWVVGTVHDSNIAVNNAILLKFICMLFLVDINWF
jgi:hypothetical protein